MSYNKGDVISVLLWRIIRPAAYWLAEVAVDLATEDVELEDVHEQQIPGQETVRRPT